MKQRLFLTMATAVCLIGAAVPSNAQSRPSGAAIVRQLDTDRDKTVSWEEAQQALDEQFAALDRDQDSSLDTKEASKAGIAGQAFKAANPDGDGTLDKEEYMKLARNRFDAADPDHDGTLSAAELDTPAGRAFKRLLHVHP